MQTVERSHFILWCKGTLIFHSGRYILCVDERNCIAAEEALERGETIGLTEHGKIVSYAKSDGKVIREIDTEE